MKLIKRPIVKLVHALGYDIIRKANDADASLFGLEKYPIGTILDVGANRGQFARRARAVFPGADLWCFEPLKAPFDDLGAWAATQGGRVRAFQTALGDSNGEAEMCLALDQDDSSSMLKITDACVKAYPITGRQGVAKVRQSTLDDFMASPEAGPARDELLIKVDTQGYEPSVIRGGRKTFGRARAAILEVCIEGMYEGQATFKQVYELMDGLGFAYRGNLEQARAADGHVLYFDAVFIRP